MPSVCPLGQCKLSILPPTAINNIDSDGYWEATRPPRTSPLLVFVNTKSGDNQVSHGSQKSTGKTKQLACQVDVEKILLMIFVLFLQGVKFLRRFKQLLNPAQVFDLMNGGPHPG